MTPFSKDPITFGGGSKLYSTWILGETRSDIELIYYLPTALNGLYFGLTRAFLLLSNLGFGLLGLGLTACQAFCHGIRCSFLVVKFGFCVTNCTRPRSFLQIWWLGHGFSNLERFPNYCFEVTFDTRTREFQYKILNRYLVTNSFPHKIRLRISEL